MKTLREDLTIHTDDGAAFPSELQTYIDTYTRRHLETYTDTQRDRDTDTMKTLREDLTIHTDDGAAFPSELTHLSRDVMNSVIMQTDCR